MRAIKSIRVRRQDPPVFASPLNFLRPRVPRANCLPREIGAKMLKLCRCCDAAPRISPRAWYCAACRVAIDKAKRRRDDAKRPPSSKRGYNAAHTALREHWAPFVARGEVACRRCGLLILDGKWDLGHFRDRSLPPHPAHQACNRRTSTYKAMRRDTVPRARKPGPTFLYPWRPERPVTLADTIPVLATGCPARQLPTWLPRRRSQEQ
jgi:hypothetical protein